MGDFNFKNIAVDRSNGNIKILDSDSFHLTFHKNGKPVVLPCTELHPNFFPPEILKLQKSHNNATFEQLHNNGYTTFTLYTDYYCLAYHIHMFLMGCPPFSRAGKAKDIATKNSVPALPNTNELEINGNYCYSNLRDGTMLPLYCPDFNIITPELQKLFIRAFQESANNPERRPTPEEFISALEPFIRELHYCNCNGWNHYLHKSWNKNYCEWCRISGYKKVIPDYIEDILLMSDTELGYFGHKPEVMADARALAYVFYEIACRYCNCGHNGESQYSADHNEIDNYLRKARTSATKGAPELISKIDALQKRKY